MECFDRRRGSVREGRALLGWLAPLLLVLAAGGCGGAAGDALVGDAGSGGADVRLPDAPGGADAVRPDGGGKADGDQPDEDVGRPACRSDADCAPFEDGDRCNGTLRCVDGLCQLDPASPVTCDTSGDTACRVTVCEAATGVCVARDRDDGTDCDDGDACTTGAACAAGVCAGGAPACDDGAPCTTDSCDPATGACAHEDVACGDGDPCTTDSCDPATGSCRHDPVVCPDDDPGDCSVPTCVPPGGACVAAPAAEGSACEDGDPCTGGDVCDGQGGCQPGTGDGCDDGDACTVDTCEVGACAHASIECADGVECTVDGCDSATGKCVHDHGPCPTGELCGNRVDDDGDTLIDCADVRDCADAPFCTRPCGPDGLEPDDTPEDATALVPDAAWSVLTAESGDDDWFAFPVCAGGTVRVTATFERAFGDVDLYLVLADGTTVAAGTYSGDDERLEWTSTVDGTLWLQVRMASTDACNEYALSIAFDDQPCIPPEDCFDGADNDGDGAADCADPDCSGAVTVAGACTNRADLRIAGTVDVTTLGPACIVDAACLADIACNSACIQEATGLSAACAGCGGALAGCVVASCTLPCLDPGAPDCESCILAECYDDYVACFGLLHCHFEYDCANEMDDDGDSLGDCEDPDCADAWECGPQPEVCVGGEDEDWDDATDCEDADCLADAACLPPAPETDCADARDDDGDGLTDCEDADCDAAPACAPAASETACDDGRDEDEDGATDCDDGDCAADPLCAGREDCFNRADDDGDGLTDCVDPDCSGTVAVQGACTNPIDLRLVAGVSFELMGRACILDQGCLGDVACNTACIRTRSRVSADCAACGGQLAACAYDRCVLACLDSGSAECATCLQTECYPGYVDCFGLLHCAFETRCYGGENDDEDGLVDCADPDCAGHVHCAACPDDSWEPDDGPERANVFSTNNSIGGLRAVGRDEDWGAVEVCAGGLLTATAEFDPAAGRLELAIVGADGTVEAAGVPVASGRRAQWTATRGGVVFVRVGSPDADTCLAYNLRLMLDSAGCAGR
jgi:hypothetical protein